MIIPFVIFMNGCTPTITTHGTLPDPEILSQIKVGQTQQEISKIMGTPTHIGGFKEPIWYYLSQKTSRKSFYAPDILETKSVAIHFDQNGIVKSIKPYSSQNTPEVAYEDRATHTPGHDATTMQKIFANFGKFGVFAKDPKKGD